MSEKLLFSVRETALRLGISIRSVDALIKTGSLPSVRVGRRVLVHITALNGFAAKGHAAGVRELAK